MDTSPEPPWLDSDERAAWMTLMAMVMTLPTAIEAQLKRDSGLNFFEYSILSSLSRPERHAVQMSNLAHMAGGSLSRLSHAVSRLERQGYVRRRTGGEPGESRCTEAVLTEEGMAALEAAAPGHVREARRLVFDHLTPAQVRQLQRIAREIAGASAPDTARHIDAEIEAADQAEQPLYGC
nr:MarR family transcriptional regulator [Actinoplanes bogorensis]